MNEDFTIKPHCDMLIAQNVFIDGEPVGHACRNEADYQNKTHFFCKSCREKLPINRGLPPLERITIPKIGSVIGWKERTENIMHQVMNSVNKNENIPIFLIKKKDNE